MAQIEDVLGTTHDHGRPPAVKTVFPSDVDDVSGAAIFRLVQTLFLSANGKALREVVFCGVDAENGSSSICASVATALAASNSGSVCMADANFRSPRLTSLFGGDKRAASQLEAASIQDQCRKVDDNLWLAGSEFLADDRGVLPSAARLKDLLVELRGAFEFVLIDAPGAGISGDAALLGQVADGTVLVVEADTTRRLAARKAKENLDAANVRLLGTVLRNRSFPVPKGLYERL